MKRMSKLTSFVSSQVYFKYLFDIFKMHLKYGDQNAKKCETLFVKDLIVSYKIKLHVF